MYSTMPLSIQCICGIAHAPALIRHNHELLSMSAFMQQSMLGRLGLGQVEPDPQPRSRLLAFA